MSASDMADSRQSQPRRGRKAGVALALIIPVLVLAGAYVAGYLMTGDRTPTNAAINGIPIGGMSRAEAEQKLTQELVPAANRDLTLSVEGKTTTVKPAEWGMKVDVPASVAKAGIGRSFDPRQIWQVLTGGLNQPAVVSFDQTTLSTKVAELAQRTDQQAKDATIAFVDGELEVGQAQPGKKLDQRSAAQAIEQAYWDNSTAELKVDLSDPAITDAAVADAAAEAKVAISAPIKLKVSGSSNTYDIPVKSIVAAYSFEQADGKLKSKIDAEKFWKANSEAVAKLATKKPVDARVEIRGGKPVVIPSVDGVAVSKESFLAAAIPAIAKTGEARTIEVQATTAKAKYTTAEAEKAGVKEIISSFPSKFPYANYRNVNLSVVAGMINNTYLAPGAQFSLNKQIGERTKAKGFVDGTYVDGGIMKQGLAGGISQSATTVYNAAFFSGARIDEHRPHTLYFPRYPAGRESTVYWPSLDVKFTNDSPYGMVVEAFVDKSPGKGTPGTITVRIWSTKYYKVETAEPVKSGFYSGKTRTVSYAGCVSQAPIQGFTATYYRITRKPDGSLARPRENFKWTYSAGDRIVCR